jgi:hypothetical protein
MARLISRLAKGAELEAADHESLKNTPASELKALLKISGDKLHETAKQGIEAMLASRKPKLEPRKKAERKKPSGHALSKKKSDPRPRTNLRLFDFSSFDYANRISGPQGSIKAFSGGGCNPR